MPARNKQRYVSTKDFLRCEEVTEPKIRQGTNNLTEYFKNHNQIKVDDIIVLMRHCLNDVLDATKTWFIKTYFNTNNKETLRTLLDNFPSLDDLIYHENGWTLDKSIEHHYNAYNKWRKINNLQNALCNILYLESDRLRNTIFDTLNERYLDRFKYVTIIGDSCCENDSKVCEMHYGTYRVAVDFYYLPPYHLGCHCYAVYHDNPEYKVD